MKKKNLINLIRLFAFSCVVSLLFLQCTKDETDPEPEESADVLKVGFLAELTGTFANNSNYDAAQLAVKEINDAGGIDGKNIELILKDAFADGGDIALESVKDLKSDGVNLIIGPGWSSRLLKVADYTIANNMLLMSYSATAASITDLDDKGLVWRSIVSDAFLTKALAEYLYNTDGVRTAGIIYRDDAWGGGLAENFTERFKSLGGEVSASLSYSVEVDDLTAIDFSGKCQQLMDANPDVLLYLSFDSDGVKFLTDLSNNSSFSQSTTKPNIYSFAGNGIDLLTTNAPAEVLPYIHAVRAVADMDENSNYTRFKSAYKTKYPASGDPDYYAACAYDMTYLLGCALLKTDDITSAVDVASYLKSVSGDNSGATVVNVNEFSSAINLAKTGSSIDYNGASGKIEFDDNGDPSSATIQISKISDGEYVAVDVSEF